MNEGIYNIYVWYWANSNIWYHGQYAIDIWMKYKANNGRNCNNGHAWK